MFFLAILILLNAFLNNDWFVNEYRLTIAGVPLNIFDILLIVGGLWALARPHVLSGYYRTSKMHPVLIACLALFVVAIFSGLIGAMNNGATARQIMTSGRNLIAAPVALFIGYSLTSTFKSSRRFLYLSIVAGLVVSFMIVVFFKEKAETRQSTANLNDVRAVAYVSYYAGLTVALLFYSLSARIRMLPVVLSLTFICVCLIGQFTTLSRSDWLAAIAAIGATVVCLPKGSRLPTLIRMKLAVPFLILSVVLGLYIGSQVTRKNMFETMRERVLTLLPGDRPGAAKHKAWETRIPGMLKELRLWASNPIFGRGLAIQDTPEAEPMFTSGLRHNSWTATLAETGLIGFGAFALMTGGMMVAGWRMVLARVDQTTVLLGTLAVCTGSFFIIIGLATMSFNQVRWGLPLFITAGVVLRTRMMHLTQMRLNAEQEAYEAYLAEQQAPEEAYAQVVGPGHAVEEPVFGNWYGSN